MAFGKQDGEIQEGMAFCTLDQALAQRREGYILHYTRTITTLRSFNQREYGASAEHRHLLQGKDVGGLAWHGKQGRQSMFIV
jgi:hypothetical protein